MANRQLTIVLVVLILMILCAVAGSSQPKHAAGNRCHSLGWTDDEATGSSDNDNDEENSLLHNIKSLTDSTRIPTSSDVQPVLRCNTCGVSCRMEKGRQKVTSGCMDLSTRQVPIRKSIDRATVMNMGTSHRELHRFDPRDWRKFKDAKGHYYFAHKKTGVKSYAMPWILRDQDRAHSVHNANDPHYWRSVDTGHIGNDGSPVMLYSNNATSQSSFDAPMFASWRWE